MREEGEAPAAGGDMQNRPIEMFDFSGWVKSVLPDDDSPKHQRSEQIKIKSNFVSRIQSIQSNVLKQKLKLKRL